MKPEKKISIQVAPSVLKSALDLAELELNSRRDAGATTGPDTDMLDQIWAALALAEKKRAGLTKLETEMLAWLETVVELDAHDDQISDRGIQDLKKLIRKIKGQK